MSVTVLENSLDNSSTTTNNDDDDDEDDNDVRSSSTTEIDNLNTCHEVTVEELREINAAEKSTNKNDVVQKKRVSPITERTDDDSEAAALNLAQEKSPILTESKLVGESLLEPPLSSSLLPLADRLSAKGLIASKSESNMKLEKSVDVDDGNEKRHRVTTDQAEGRSTSKLEVLLATLPVDEDRFWDLEREKELQQQQQAEKEIENNKRAIAEAYEEQIEDEDIDISARTADSGDPRLIVEYEKQLIRDFKKALSKQSLRVNEEGAEEN